MAPTNLLERLQAFLPKTHVDKPVISSWTAAGLSSLCVVLYVLPFYLSKATRPSPTLSRDAPSVIRARIRSVSTTCAVSTVAVLYLLLGYANFDVPSSLRLLGWWPIDPLAILQVLGLCVVLFVGPLFDAGIAQQRWRAWITGEDVVPTLSSWTGWRNLVAGPVTEEIMFRSLFVTLHLLAHWKPSRIVFITPLYFGIAHVHHFYETTLIRPDMPKATIALVSLAQFTYTSLFGFFAAFVYLRTGSIYAVIVAHMFCNWTGLPRFWGPIRVDSGEAIGPAADAQSKKSDLRNPGTIGRSSSRRVSRSFTAIYYGLLLVGAFGFYKLLWPMTESSGNLADFSGR